jgi:hypothetical protein
MKAEARASRCWDEFDTPRGSRTRRCAAGPWSSSAATAPPQTSGGSGSERSMHFSDTPGLFPQGPHGEASPFLRPLRAGHLVAIDPGVTEV